MASVKNGGTVSHKINIFITKTKNTKKHNWKLKELNTMIVP